MPDLGALVPVLLLLLGGAGWWIRHEQERREAVESQLSPKKYDTYMALLNIFFDVLKAGNTGSKPVPELAARMMDAKKDLLIYGTDEVFLTFQQWTDSVSAGEKTMLHGFGDVILAIRRDMGHPKTKLTSDNVLRSFITDFEEMRRHGRI